MLTRARGADGNGTTPKGAVPVTRSVFRKVIRERAAVLATDAPSESFSSESLLGAIEKRPKVVTGPDGEDTIAIRTCSYFSLSFDHRIIDGAVADGFLAFVKSQIENFPDAVL